MVVDNDHCLSGEACSKSLHHLTFRVEAKDYHTIVSRIQVKEHRSIVMHEDFVWDKSWTKRTNSTNNVRTKDCIHDALKPNWNNGKT